MARWYVLGAVLLWVVLSSTAAIIAVLFKKRWGHPWPSATPSYFEGLLRLDIIVPDHWSIQPGQYVRIWMPCAGLRACLQLPSFPIASWEDENSQRTLHILTWPLRSSLTARLHKNTARQPIMILGPYCQVHNFSTYGTVLFMVEDIGIMQVLPFIRMLVQLSQQRKVMVRQLIIVWQMDNTDNECWLNEWMQPLLDLDRDAFEILRFQIYYRHIGESGEPPSKRGERIHLCPGSMDAEGLIQSHLDQRHGDMAVGVCTSAAICDTVRKLIQPKLGDGLHFVDFQMEPVYDVVNRDRGSNETQMEEMSKNARPHHNHAYFVNSRIAEARRR